MSMFSASRNLHALVKTATPKSRQPPFYQYNPGSFDLKPLPEQPITTTTTTNKHLGDRRMESQSISQNETQNAHLQEIFNKKCGKLTGTQRTIVQLSAELCGLEQQ